MRIESDKNRSELKHYYKKVNICSLCNKEYGLDDPELTKYINTCPICINKIKYDKNIRGIR